MITLEKIEYNGWPHCLKLSNQSIEIIVTTDVGPRVIFFGWKDSKKNLFHVDEKAAGKTGGDRWRSYGGHRFWHAPEIKPRTYVPDNSPVAHDWDGQCLRLVQDVEQLTGLQKIIEIIMHESQPSLTVHHQLVNHGPWEISAAPWALSVLAPGGTAIIPQEPFVPFPDALLPARPLVLWQYTNMADPRFGWKEKFVSLKQDSSRTEQLKFGVRNSVGWGCYVLGDTAFIKGTTLNPEAKYPDFGCNWEVYTDKSFLELETLGPLQPIAATGGTVEHVEEWSLSRVEPDATLEEVFQQVHDHGAVTA